MDILDYLAPVKHKYVRANQAPFMNKCLNKSVVEIGKLKKKYLKNKTPLNWLEYEKQRNSCVSLFRKQRKAFYSCLDVKAVVDNKVFWKVVKPSFSDKIKGNENITLIENHEIINEEKKICEL